MNENREYWKLSDSFFVEWKIREKLKLIKFCLLSCSWLVHSFALVVMNWRPEKHFLISRVSSPTRGRVRIFLYIWTPLFCFFHHRTIIIIRTQKSAISCGNSSVGMCESTNTIVCQWKCKIFIKTEIWNMVARKILKSHDFDEHDTQSLRWAAAARNSTMSWNAPKVSVRFCCLWL